MKKYLLIVFIFSTSLNYAQVIYNAYAKVTTLTSTQLTVTNVNQVNHTFNVGEQVIVMQMQDNVIGTNTTNVATFGDISIIGNAGVFEKKTISAVNLSAGTPTSIVLTTPLINTYNTGVNSSVQIITFRQLSATAFTSTNNITGLVWNGNVGGIIAIEVPTIFTLGHSITANAIGFVGGLKNTPNFASTSCDANFIMAIGNKWAGKGEGIYKNTNTAFTGARGKILTGGGGGNDENSGGGGGGNFTVGGIGGPGFTGGATGCSPTRGGLGGITLSLYINPSRIFMGGGGGAGHENNNVGTVGGAGGGIILLKTGTLTTTGACSTISITANGATAANSGNDGSGGGGAAGSIVFEVNSYSIVSTCSIIINANGGTGGNAVTGSTHSGGGGGGQGALVFSTPQPTLNVSASTTPGNGGLSCSGCASSVNATNGGGPNNAGIIINGSGPLPIELLKFNAENQDTKVALTWATATERNTNYFYVERSTDAINWQKISQVKAAENSSKTLYYETDDNEPLFGNSYYRLKIIDLDNSFSYSPIKSIYRTKKEAFVVFYPNPTIGIVNLSSSYSSNQIKFKIFDVTGKELTVNITNQTDDKITFDFSTLAKGLYFINVSAHDGTEFSSNRIILK